MKSQPSHRELLIIRLICYSFIVWAVSYVYMNSWTGLNINKLEAARIARMETKTALKKSLSVLVEAGFSDEEILDKQIELLSYFLGEAEIEESKEILSSLEKTLSSSTSIDCAQRTKAYSMAALAYQYFNDFQKAIDTGEKCTFELKKALSDNQINEDEYKKLAGIMKNNMALSEYLRAGCEENFNLRRKQLVKCIKGFEEANKMLKNEKSLAAISQSNSKSASSELVFDKF